MPASVPTRVADAPVNAVRAVVCPSHAPSNRSVSFGRTGVPRALAASPGGDAQPTGGGLSTPAASGATAVHAVRVGVVDPTRDAVALPAGDCPTAGAGASGDSYRPTLSDTRRDDADVREPAGGSSWARGVS